MVNEYTLENLNLAREIIAENKDYHKLKDLHERLTSFELHKSAVKWIENYNYLHSEKKNEKK